MKKFKVALCAAVVPLLLLSACTTGPNTGGDDGGEPGGEGTHVLYLPKFVGHPVFNAFHQGMEEQAELYGWTVDYNGPAQASATEQVSFIDTAVSSGLDGIIAEPNDGAVIVPSLLAAREQGLSVITFDADTPTDKSARSAYVTNAPTEQIATILLDMLGEQIDFEGDFAILSSQASNTAQQDWVAEIERNLEETPKYQNMTNVATINPADDLPATAVTAAEQLLRQYPDIKGVIAPSASSLTGMAQVVEQGGTCDKYVVTGLSDPGSMKSYVDSGCIEVFAGQDYVEMGSVALCTLHAVMTGEITDEDGNAEVGAKFDCGGDLGEQEVLEEGDVTGGLMKRFSADNIDEFA